MIEIAKNIFKNIDGLGINENNDLIKTFIPKFAENKEIKIKTFDEADNVLKDKLASRDINPNSENRELTEDEKEYVAKKTGWSEKQLDKCTIDSEGVIHYKCNNEDLEGKEYKDTGVYYEKKVIEYNGLKIEVVAPKFDSKFDVNLPEDLIKADNSLQFKECNEQLKQKIEKDESLRKEFNEDQLEDIINGDTPEGYTWHHDAEVGKMQLVESKKHNAPQGGVPHTGGKSIWGGQY